MTPRPVYLYVTDTMADWEPGFAIAQLNRPLYQHTPGRYVVRTVANTTDPITTAGGVRILPDTTVDAITAGETALLMLPGADTWDLGDDRHAPVLTKAREFLAAGTPVAAICGATYGLASAGLLDDRAHTSNAAMYLEASGYAGASRYREEPAVTDSGLITASGIKPVDFARAIFEALDLYEPKVLDAWYGLYTTGDLEHYLVLASA